MTHRSATMNPVNQYIKSELLETLDISPLIILDSMEFLSDIEIDDFNIEKSFLSRNGNILNLVRLHFSYGSVFFELDCIIEKNIFLVNVYQYLTLSNFKPNQELIPGQSNFNDSLINTLSIQCWNAINFKEYLKFMAFATYTDSLFQVDNLRLYINGVKLIEIKNEETVSDFREFKQLSILKEFSDNKYFTAYWLRSENVRVGMNSHFRHILVSPKNLNIMKDEIKSNLYFGNKND